jgi:hypothetical protein
VNKKKQNLFIRFGDTGFRTPPLAQGERNSFRSYRAAGRGVIRDAASM